MYRHRQLLSQRSTHGVTLVCNKSAYGSKALHFCLSRRVSFTRRTIFFSQLLFFMWHPLESISLRCSCFAIVPNHCNTTIQQTQHHIFNLVVFLLATYTRSSLFVSSFTFSSTLCFLRRHSLSSYYFCMCIRSFRFRCTYLLSFLRVSSGHVFLRWAG